MNLKFNGGRGALLCSKCQVILDENFNKETFDSYCMLHERGVEFMCRNCDSTIQQSQSVMLFEELQRCRSVSTKNKGE